MSDDKYDFSDPETSSDRADKANKEPQDIGVGTARGLSYSSPWPWVRAIMIALLLWAGIAALIWKLF